MPDISISVQSSRDMGTRPARRLRREGKVPAVIYGHGIEPIPVAVETRALRSALTTAAGLNALLELDLGGEKHLVLTREMQRHPVKGSVSHVDFQVVRRDEQVSAEVPVSIVGEATKVDLADGMVDQQLFTLNIKAQPSKIPSVVEVDITEMEIGDSIKVADIPLPDGVVADTDGEVAVVSALAGRATKIAAAGSGEGAQGAEGGAGEGSGGE